jgi:hypothetical protein
MQRSLAGTSEVRTGSLLMAQELWMENTFNKKLIINHTLLRGPEESRILKAILAIYVDACRTFVLAFFAGPVAFVTRKSRLLQLRHTCLSACLSVEPLKELSWDWNPGRFANISRHMPAVAETGHFTWRIACCCAQISSTIRWMFVG